MTNKDLKHFGILGMHWGVRRQRPPSHADSVQVHTLRKKRVNELSNDDIRKVITRMQLERQFKEVNSARYARGQKFVGTLLKGVGGQLLSEFLRDRRTPSNMDDVFNAGKRNKQRSRGTSGVGDFVEGQVVG